MFEVLIVGTGPAGLYAAYNAGMRHLKAGVIESLPYVGGQLTTLYKDKPIYDLAGHLNVTAGEFVELLYKQYRRFEEDVPIYFDTLLTSVRKEEDHFVVETNKGDFLTKVLLLSTGGGTFEPRKLKVPGGDAHNVYYRVDKVDDFKNKKVAVLGGGDSALDWAVMLTDQAKSECTLVHRRSEFRAHENSIAKFEKMGTIMAPYNVEEVIVDENNNATGLRLTDADGNESILETDAVVVNYGFVPTKSFLADWDILSEDSAFVVHTTQETSIPGIFAIGNAATYDGKLKNISSGLGEATTAMGVINHILHPGKMKHFLK